MRVLTRWQGAIFSILLVLVKVLDRRQEATFNISLVLVRVLDNDKYLLLIYY